MSLLNETVVRLLSRSSPGVSDAAEGRIYFDTTQNLFLVSQNGSSYVTLGTSTSGGGWTDDGTVVRLTTVTDQVGIGTASPGANSKLEVLGDATARNILLTGGTTTGATTGGAVTLTSGQGGATGVGGALNLAAGSGGSTSGAGGISSLIGGAGVAGNAAGGASTVVGGAGQGSAAGGQGQVTGGVGGATGLGGSVVLTGGAGGATSGAGGSATLIGGAGTAGNSAGGATTVQGGAGQGSALGGLTTIQGGTGGATGNGGGITLYGGSAGAAAGTGGEIILQTAVAAAGTTAIERLRVTQDGALDTTGIATASAPAVSAANNGRMYYDSTLQQYMASINGGAYKPLTGGAGLATNVVTKTANYTITRSDFTIRSNNGGGGTITMTLPAVVASIRGQIFVVKRVNAGAGAANRTVVAAAGGETIDGAASTQLNAQYATLMVQAPDTGTDWMVI